MMPGLEDNGGIISNFPDWVCKNGVNIGEEGQGDPVAMRQLFIGHFQILNIFINND
jgi:hypothetical protein